MIHVPRSRFYVLPSTFFLPRSTLHDPRSKTLLTIAIFLFAAFLLLALLTFPWRLARTAVANARRLDGTISRKRAAIEARKGGSFMAEVLLVPLLATTLLSSGFMIVDQYLIPLPMLRDIVSMFDIRFSTWDERMEAGRFGDVGLTYGEWARSRGYSDDLGYTLRKFMKNNWFALIVAAALAAAAVYWFVAAYYIAILRRYRICLLRRREDYRKVDVVRSVASPVASRQ